MIFFCLGNNGGPQSLSGNTEWRAPPLIYPHSHFSVCDEDRHHASLKAASPFDPAQRSNEGTLRNEEKHQNNKGGVFGRTPTCRTSGKQATHKKVGCLDKTAHAFFRFFLIGPQRPESQGFQSGPLNLSWSSDGRSGQQGENNWKEPCLQMPSHGPGSDPDIRQVSGHRMKTHPVHVVLFVLPMTVPEEKPPPRIQV